MREKCAAGVDLGELEPHGGADFFDDLILVEEINFAFRGMYINVNALGVNVQAQVDEWAAPFGQESRVGLLQSFSGGGGFDSTMVDEEKKHSFLDVIVCIRHPAASLESVLVVADRELNKFVGHRAPVNLADAVHSGSVGRRENSHGGVAMLLA